MGDRSGSGSAGFESVVAELDKLRESLVRQRRTKESVEESQRMSADLAAIQAGLKRIADQLGRQQEAR